MSQRFIRCPHCGLPHRLEEVVCPSTGLALPKSPTAPPQAPRAREQSSTSHRRDIIGRTVDGKYRFLSLLGEGGMGAVFEAEHVGTGRPVAVKVLHPSQAKKKVAVKRFHQEARAASKIGHPNICEVSDLGTLADGAPYLVMEKLVGSTLAERIAREGGLPVDDVLDIVIQALSGLIAAHEKGIVHRDIKPENVFLCDRAGAPPLAKILDFGVSKMIAAQHEEELDLTRTGMVMGTPFYMSPEQARGDRNLDARVDVWACGVMLYEALTGRRPFIAANYNALLLQILTAEPRPLREFRPATPEALERILAHALARNRDERYRGAAEFQRDLLVLRGNHADAYGRPFGGDTMRIPAATLAEVHPARARKAAPAVRIPAPVPMVPSRATDSPRGPKVAPPPLVPPEARVSAAAGHSPERRPPDSASDPLARLPSLEPRYDDEERDTSGTHIALDLVESGEMGGTDPEAPPPESVSFDDIPTEVVESPWDEETTRKSVDPAAPLRRPKRPSIRIPAANVEDTVKIEGDIEAHFARMHPAEEKPRGPGSRRRR
jgi:eukaryotic-like serine/threonine-protein kinase